MVVATLSRYRAAWTIGIAVLVVLAALFALSLSTQNSEQFSRLQPWLLLASAIGVVVLSIMLARKVLQLVNAYRTNVAGSPKFAKAIKAGDWDGAVAIARQQVESGANIIDINVDEALIDGEATMVRFLNLIASEPEIARVPVMIDSSKWSVLEKGLQCLQGKGIVNSISLKDGEAEFLRRAARGHELLRRRAHARHQPRPDAQAVSARFIGAHTPDAGGMVMAVRRAAASGMTALQVFTAPPTYYGDKVTAKPPKVQAFRDALAAAGIERTSVTLHVGPGTFRPITADDPRAHDMEEEWFEVSEATAAELRATRARGGRIVAVGTTSVRALESMADATDGALTAASGWTRKYILPPYTFRAVDALITNFHLPQSSLLMLVSAFAGRERVLAAYREAVARGYRFYSYGDCMLIV